VIMVWTEHGGPAVTPPNDALGFGSRLLDRIVTRKLRGSIDYQWNPEGLIATVRLRTERLLA
jgi:two-component sensor histidine kinase